MRRNFRRNDERPLIKRNPLFIAVLIFVISACANHAPQATPTVATIISTTTVPGTKNPTATDSPTVVATVVLRQTIPAPPGLQVVYLREGNLWFWTERGGNVLLTGTGDMTVLRLSENGQLLAFMRGPEVWTVRMNGTGARQLNTLKEAGGSLSFAPDGSLLAVSTADHIDVIDLKNASSTTVVSYPVLPNDYYPEVIWSTDAKGFKTVIPPYSVKGLAQFLFVFPDGKTANLAKFEMISPSESPPAISPDGGYVIFVAQLGDGRESLYLMDSSGAAKPYGEPAEHVRTLGWLPGSKQFVYEWQNQEQRLILLGGLNGTPPMEVVIKAVETIRWLDAEHFLAIQDNNLYLVDINGGETLIAESVSNFDFDN